MWLTQQAVRKSTVSRERLSKTHAKKTHVVRSRGVVGGDAERAE